LERSLRSAALGCVPALDGAPERGHAHLVDPLWLLTRTTDHDVRVVVGNDDLAYGTDLQLTAHPSVIGSARAGDKSIETSADGDRSGRTGVTTWQDRRPVSVDADAGDRREREEVLLQEMLHALTPGNFSAGRLMRKRMLRMLDEQVAPAAVDLFIWDMELTGELNPFLA
jgi:hypothetical protein